MDGTELVLAPEDVDALVGCLAHLDEAQAAEVAVHWLANQASSARDEPLALANIAMRAAKVEPETVAPMMDGLEQMWLESGAAEAGDLDAVEAIGQTYRSVGNSEKANQWVMRAYGAVIGSEESRATVEIDQLTRLAVLMREQGLTDVGTGYTAFAAALGVKARDGTLEGRWFRMRNLAAPLGTVETRQILEEELLDAQGNPRQGVAQVLSWTYHHLGEIEAWKDMLDQKAAQTSGDAKALWLLARSYAQSTVLVEPNPLIGEKWLSQALAASATDTVRLLALDELARGYMMIQKHETAIGLLESVAGQIDTDEGRERFEALQARVQTSAVRAESHRIRDLAIREARAKTAWRSELERRLDRARSEGDAEAVGRYSRLLERSGAEGAGWSDPLLE